MKRNYFTGRTLATLALFAGLFFSVNPLTSPLLAQHDDGDGDDHGGTPPAPTAPASTTGTTSAAGSIVHVSAPATMHAHDRGRIVFVPIAGGKLLSGATATLTDVVGTTTRQLTLREGPSGVYSFEGTLDAVGVHSLTFSVTSGGATVTQATQVTVESPGGSSGGLNVSFKNLRGHVEVPVGGGTVTDSLTFELRDSLSAPVELTTTQVARCKVFVEDRGTRQRDVGTQPTRTLPGTYSIPHNFSKSGKRNVVFWYDANNDALFQRSELATFRMDVHQAEAHEGDHDSDADNHDGGGDADTHDADTDTHDGGADADTDTHDGGADADTHS